MQNLSWQRHFPYQVDYSVNFIENVNRITEAQQGAPTYSDFSHLDLIHPGAHEGVDILFRDYSLPSTVKVLEIGTGYGGTSRHIHFNQGVSILGFDYTQAIVDASVHANKILHIENEVKHQQGDACTIQLPENSFDLAIAISVFFHIDNDAAILNTCRFIQPGGLLYIEDYYFAKNRDEFNEDDHWIIEQRSMHGTRTKAETTDVLARAGMEVLEMSEFGFEWSKPAWERAEAIVKAWKEGTSTISEERYNQYGLISPQISSDLNRYTIEELKEMFPYLSKEIALEEVVFKRQKLISVYRVVARKIVS